MRFAIPLALALACAASGSALANDSTSELAAGGLVLKQTDKVTMKSEDLFVSKEQVRVRYVFRNVTDSDATLRVAFPLPDIPAPGPASGYNIPSENPENPVDFATEVDGKPVRMQLEQRAILEDNDANGNITGEHDITDTLKALNIPLADYLPATDEALKRLSPAQLQKLIDEKIVWMDEYDVGEGMQEHPTAGWKVRNTFHWEQVFPTGRDLKVEHRYKPIIGGSAGTSVLSQQPADEYDTKWCVDKDFVVAVRRTQKPGADEWDVPFYEQWIGYILKTGGNWQGPIGHFTLTVDKGRKDSLVSFCADGVKKISDTQFQVVHENWKPDRDLNVLILERLPIQEK